MPQFLEAHTPNTRFVCPPACLIVCQFQLTLVGGGDGEGLDGYNTNLRSNWTKPELLTGTGLGKIPGEEDRNHGKTK